jgi:hypothetical protein
MCASGSRQEGLTGAADYFAPLVLGNAVRCDQGISVQAAHA